MVARIPAVVATMGVTGRACCVVLMYPPTDPLSVLVHVTSEDERRSVIAAYADDRTMIGGRPWIGDLWAFGDAPGDEPVDLGAVAETARRLSGQFARTALDGGTDPGRDLLCAVAAELNGHDWPRVVPVTDDFVVYAVDVEMTDLERNLLACVPAARIELLRERGLL